MDIFRGDDHARELAAFISRVLKVECVWVECQAGRPDLFDVWVGNRYFEMSSLEAFPWDKEERKAPGSFAIAAEGKKENPELRSVFFQRHAGYRQAVRDVLTEFSEEERGQFWRNFEFVSGISGGERFATPWHAGVCSHHMMTTLLSHLAVWQRQIAARPFMLSREASRAELESMFPADAQPLVVDEAQDFWTKAGFYGAVPERLRRP